MAYAITTNFNITVAISALNSVFNCTGFCYVTPCYDGFFTNSANDNSPGTTMQGACSMQ